MKQELGGLITSTTARGVRSGTDGMMTVPVQDWTRLPMKARVHAGGLVSQPFQPAAGDRVVDIVVR